MPAAPGLDGSAYAAGLNGSLDATPAAPFEPQPARLAGAFDPAPPLGQLADGRPLLDDAGPTVDGPAFGPAAPAFGAGGVFGSPEPVLPAGLAPDSWRNVEIPAVMPTPTAAEPTPKVDAELPELPTRPVRNAGVTSRDAEGPILAAPTGTAVAEVAPALSASPVGPAASVDLESGTGVVIPPTDIVAGGRYADLPRAAKPGDIIDGAILPSRQAPAASADDAAEAEVALPGRPRTPVLPARMPSVGLAGGVDESPFTGATPALPARPTVSAPPVVPVAEGGPVTPTPLSAAVPSVPAEAAALPASPAPALPPPPAVSAKAAVVGPPPTRPVAVPPPARTVAPAPPVPAVPAPPPVPAASAVPAPPAIPTAPAIPAGLATAPPAGQTPPAPVVQPTAAVAPPSLPAPPAPPPRLAVQVPAPPPARPAVSTTSNGEGTNSTVLGDDPTTPSGLRKRVRQEPAVAFNRFAQQDDVNVRKSRSPEAMKDRLMSFTAGKSAAKTTDSEETSDEAEPQFVSRTDQVLDSPSTNPPTQS